MEIVRILKVQTPAVRVRRPGGRGEWRLGAHTFVALADAAGVVRRELHGIARGPGGTQLAMLGGVLPFRREVLWGEAWAGPTGFYAPDYPQGLLFEGTAEAVAALLARAAAVRAAVNGAGVRYAWPAFAGANSNGYYATLLAGMGLEDVGLAGELWAPGIGRPVLDAAVLAEIARAR